MAIWVEHSSENAPPYLVVKKVRETFGMFHFQGKAVSEESAQEYVNGNTEKLSLDGEGVDVFIPKAKIKNMQSLKGISHEELQA
jgi:hypothetical protein